MAFLYLPPFDPSRDFIVRLPKRIGGRVYAKGEALNKASVDDRLLRMLYDHHQIGYKGEEVRRDIRSAHPRRRARDGGDPQPPALPPKAEKPKGPTQRPITNPNRRRRARGGPEAGADAGGAQAAAQSAGEAPESAPAEGAPAGDNQEASPDNLNRQAASPPPAPANDLREDRIAALVRNQDRASLVSLANKLPGFRSSMSKTQLATLIVGPDDGAA